MSPSGPRVAVLAYRVFKRRREILSDQFVLDHGILGGVTCESTVILADLAADDLVGGLAVTIPSGFGLVDEALPVDFAGPPR
jgi:hypothetical protein